MDGEFRSAEIYNSNIGHHLSSLHTFLSEKIDTLSEVIYLSEHWPGPINSHFFQAHENLGNEITAHYYRYRDSKARFSVPAR